MAFVIEKRLNSRERARKCEECEKFLQEEGRLPDLELIRKTLLDAHSLTQTLANGLHEQEQNGLAAAKLAAHIEALIQTLKV